MIAPHMQRIRHSEGGGGAGAAAGGFPITVGGLERFRTARPGSRRRILI